MKKILSVLLATILCITMLFSLTACSPETATPGGDGSADITATNTPSVSGDVTPPTDVNLPSTEPTPYVPEGATATVWQVTELSFETNKEYSAASGEQGKLEFYGEFTHKDTGKTLTIPGFWDGGQTFKLRFAPTLAGTWNYKTICAEDDSLANKTGDFVAADYTGDLAIYKHGFVKSERGKKYFVFDDGTPFFYIGDTHWGMMSESFDSAGEHAGNIQTNSHFKYIVDKRVEQGYTVYQSQIETASLNDKIALIDGRINRTDVLGFQNIDRYFNYIAEKGLVHAHAQFNIFPPSAGPLVGNDEALDDLARYWVARYGAYPVMWTLAQECDNDFYYHLGRQNHTTVENNIWVKVAEYINKYDAYNHPTSGHQETYPHVSATGETSMFGKTNEGASVFISDEVTAKTGHDWWAAQWRFEFNVPQTAFNIGKEYWPIDKVSVMYEGRYAFFYTKEFGARAQGWLAYLNGFFGYGYGAQDMWMYKYGVESQTDVWTDGYDNVTPDDRRNMLWSQSIELQSGYQVGYMRQFFETAVGDWYNLVPDFDNGTYFESSESDSTAKKRFSIATNGNSKYVLYLYNEGSAKSGTLKGLDKNATYTVKWYNPQTNAYTTVGTSVKANGSGSYVIPAKPSTSDWVLLVTKN